MINLKEVEQIVQSAVKSADAEVAANLNVLVEKEVELRCADLRTQLEETRQLVAIARDLADGKLLSYSSEVEVEKIHGWNGDIFGRCIGPAMETFRVGLRGGRIAMIEIK